MTATCSSSAPALPGMECAIVLGKRGFRRVHLVEAEAEVGGIMRWIPQLPGRGEWGRVLNWRSIQLGKLGNVEVLTGLRLDADGVRDYGAELVVVATGAHWAPVGLNRETHEPIAGADASLPHVLTPEQIMVAGQDRRPASGSSSTTRTATSWARTSRRSSP